MILRASEKLWVFFYRWCTLKPREAPHNAQEMASAASAALNPHIRAFLAKLNALPAVVPSRVAAALRRKAFFNFAVTGGGELASVRRVDDHLVDGSMRARVYYPHLPAAAAAAAPAVSPGFLFLHGGGWHAGSITTHENVCRRLANTSRCAIVSLDYRLSPEHIAPAALDDTLRGYRWLAANAASMGIDAERLGIAGDSAGGNLAAAAALTLCRGASSDPPPPKALVLIYPSLDLTASSGPSYEQFGEGFYLRLESMRHYVNIYLNSVDATPPAPAGGDARPAPAVIPAPGALDIRDPRVSPLFASDGDLARFPVTLIESAGFDPLLSDSVAFEARLRALGVPVAHHCEEGFIHAWMHLQVEVPEVVPALEALGARMAAAIETVPRA